MVIVGVDIEVGNLADTIAGGILRDRGHIVDAEACAVVGLIGQAVFEVLVVVGGRDGALFISISSPIVFVFFESLPL